MEISTKEILLTVQRVSQKDFPNSTEFSLFMTQFNLLPVQDKVNIMEQLLQENATSLLHHITRAIEYRCDFPILLDHFPYSVYYSYLSKSQSTHPAIRPHGPSSM